MTAEPEIWKFVDTHYERIMKKHMGIEGPFKIVPEYTLPNGQRVDRVILGTNKKILALIECKGDVGMNEFVGGVGQAFQGYFQIKKNLEKEMDEKAKSFLIIPKEMVKKVSLNLFDLTNITLLLADTKTGTTVEYSEKDYISTNPEEWITINPYYFRDCSLEGVFFFLKLILKNSANKEKLTLNQMEDQIKKIMKNKDEEFFGDVRNNHIVPSVLGFYDPSTKSLTTSGYEFSKKSFYEFCEEIILRVLGEYSRAVTLAIISIGNQRERDKEGYFQITTQEILEFIKKMFNGKKITYLMDPDNKNRNLLTIIRMLEFVGAIKRKGFSSMKINYYPFEGLPFQMKDFTSYPSVKLKFWFEEFNLAL